MVFFIYNLGSPQFPALIQKEHLMRRRTLILAAVAWMAGLAITISSITTAEFPVPPVIQTVIEGFVYLVSDEQPDPYRSDVRCAPAQVDACRRITESAAGVVVLVAAMSVTDFVVH